MAECPKLHEMDGCGSELTPDGNQTLERHKPMSNKRNFDPSAIKAIMTTGNNNPGQKKPAGSGENTKSHVKKAERVLARPDTKAMMRATFHVRSISIKLDSNISEYQSQPS
jgi:hypothetical protein